jgi:hypothetical protein
MLKLSDKMLILYEYREHLYTLNVKLYNRFENIQKFMEDTILNTCSKITESTLTYWHDSLYNTYDRKFLHPG